MKRLRVILVSVVGFLGGASLGAALLGITTYTAQGLDYFGQPMKVWAGAAAIGGAIYGSAPGLVLGIAIAATEHRRIAASLLGAGIGLIVAVPILIPYFFTPASMRETKDLLILVAPIPMGAFLGLALATITAFVAASQTDSQPKATP